MEQPSAPTASHFDLDQLRARFPRWKIGVASDRRDPQRFEAVAREPGTNPRVLITADLAELEAELDAVTHSLPVIQRPE